VGNYRFSTYIAAPRERVFATWIDLDRMTEWVGGVTRVTDVTGPVDRAGTRYTTWFGSMRSQTEVVEADPPRLLKTRFGNRVLRGTNTARFETEGDGTRLTQDFHTEGLVAAIMARIFATGSYKGSFQGELNDFARLVERDAQP
jgi:uncharacterized protein YndB with AHSA1/START domain